MNKKGFTLIELLIVVAIIGIIAAIAIPNLLVALQKGKQKSTMGDMKSIGTAVMSYSVDWSFVPQTDAAGLSDPANGLIPFHIKTLPITDSWGTEFEYVPGVVGTNDQDMFTTVSYGRGGVSDGVVRNTFYDCTTIGDFNADIALADGEFVQGPRSKR